MDLGLVTTNDFARSKYDIIRNNDDLVVRSKQELSLYQSVDYVGVQ